jgi:N-acetylglutamate synthase-like GNAT family acetyltransferase
MPFPGVRPAVPEDEEPIYQMLLKLHTENGLFPVAENKVREVIRTATERRYGLIGVIEGEKELEASVGLELSQWWYTDEWCLSEKWNFVLPQYRKSLHAQNLIEYAKWSARAMGVPLQMGIITTKQTEAKVRLYERRMQNVGALFMDNLPGRLEVN